MIDLSSLQVLSKIILVDWSIPVFFMASVEQNKPNSSPSPHQTISKKVSIVYMAASISLKIK